MFFELSTNRKEKIENAVREKYAKAGVEKTCRPKGDRAGNGKAAAGLEAV